MKGLRIYVHGRPKGQDIWSKTYDTSDNVYLEPFLGSKLGADVHSAMITDIWRNNSYYTYIHCNNVYEKSRDRGACSYFAITIRIDGMRCTNIQTLYNLLEQIYTIKCLGTFICKLNESEAFLVDRFEEKIQVLTEIVTIIEQNIEKHLSFEPIEKAHDTRGTLPHKYSTEDVNSPAFVKDIKENKLIISDFYLSKGEELNTSLKQVSTLKQQYNSLSGELNSCKQKRAEQEEQIKKLQNDLLLQDKQRKSLESQLQNVSEKISSDYKKQLKDKTEELDKSNKKNKQLNDSLNEANRRLKEIEIDKEYLADFKRLKEPLIQFSRKISENTGKELIVEQKTGNVGAFWKKRLLSIVNFVLLVVILLLILSHSCNPVKSSGEDVAVLYNKIDSLETTLKKERFNYVSLRDVITKNCKIDVDGYSGKGNLIGGNKYTFSVQLQDVSYSYINASVGGNGKLQIENPELPVIINAVLETGDTISRVVPKN